MFAQTPQTNKGRYFSAALALYFTLLLFVLFSFFFFVLFAPFKEASTALTLWPRALQTETCVYCPTAASARPLLALSPARSFAVAASGLLKNFYFRCQRGDTKNEPATLQM